MILTCWLTLNHYWSCILGQVIYRQQNYVLGVVATGCDDRLDQPDIAVA